jgi:hypothetical protein
MGALNSMFITLIPKKQDDATFKDLRPISLVTLFTNLYPNLLLII